MVWIVLRDDPTKTEGCVLFPLKRGERGKEREKREEKKRTSQQSTKPWNLKRSWLRAYQVLKAHEATQCRGEMVYRDGQCFLLSSPPCHLPMACSFSTSSTDTMFIFMQSTHGPVQASTHPSRRLSFPPHLIHELCECSPPYDGYADTLAVPRPKYG